MPLALRVPEWLLASYVVLTFAGSIFVAFLVPMWMRVAHVRRQNALMHTCRAYYATGVQALDSGLPDEASALLARIRTIEAKWRLRNSIFYRIFLACLSICLAFAACVLARFAMIAGMVVLEGRSLMTLQLDFAGIGTMSLASLSGALWGLHGWLNATTPSPILDDCGDRLSRHISSPRSLAVTPVDRRRGLHRTVFGLTDLELFGLNPTFTRRELDRARRVLVPEFHPDRWQAVSAEARRAAEDAMKHVNAAYDRLRRYC